MADDYRNTYNGVGTLGSLTDGGTSSGVVYTGGDHDVFSMSLVAGRTYNFELQGAGGFPNTKLALYDGGGSLVTSQLGFTGSPATILYTPTASGTFYLDAASAYSGEGGSYTLKSIASFTDDYRDNTVDTHEPAATLTIGAEKSGSIESIGDKDVFGVALTAGTTYTITVHGQSLMNKSVTLMDASGNYVTSQTGFGLNGDAVILYTPTSTGNFFLEAKSAYSSETGAYTIKIADPFVDDFRDTYNNTSEALGTVAPGGSATGNVEVDSDKDIFALSVVAGTTYTVSLAGSGGSPLDDAKVTIYNGSGLYQTSQSGFDTATARATFTATETGTYYVEAAGAYGANKGTYTVSVSNGVADDYRDTINDPSEPLGSIAPGTTRTGTIETADDTDIFAVTLSAGNLYTFDLVRVGSDLDGTTLTLFDKNGVIIYANAGYGSDGATISHAASETGTYYLRAAGDENPTTGGYQLKVSAPREIPDGFRNTYNSASKPLGTVKIDGAVSLGRIETAGDRDMFKVKLEKGQSYTIDLTGRPVDSFSTLADPELRLLKSNGAQLLINDDYNGSNSRIVVTPTKTGTYFLEASSSPDAGFGGYQVQVRKNYDDVRDGIKDKVGPSASAPSNGHVWGDLETVGDKDLYQLNLPTGHCYRVEVIPRGPNPLDDPALRILDSKGKAIGTNDDYNGKNPVYHILPTGSGSFIEVSGKGTGGYDVVVTPDYDDARDSLADTTAPTVSLAKGAWHYGYLETSGDTDLHNVVLEKGKSYVFDLERSSLGGAALGNPELTLRDSAGNAIATNNDFNGPNARLVFTPTANGTYYLDAHASPSSGLGGYRLQFREGLDDFADSITDPASPMGKLKLNGSVMGAIETRGDDDFFKFKLVKGKTYEVTVTGDTAGNGGLVDPDMHILDSKGTQLAYIDDEIGNDPSFLFTVNKTGDYYLDIGGVKSGTGLYTVTWHEVV